MTNDRKQDVLVGLLKALYLQLFGAKIDDNAANQDHYEEYACISLIHIHRYMVLGSP